MAQGRRGTRILLWVGAGLGLLVLIAAVALALFDWNMLKDRIEREITAATGREAQIQGDVSLDWGFPLRFRFEGIRLANAPWSEHENMLTADALSVGLSVASLLTGKVDVTGIELTGPELLLERSEDGQANWQLAGTSQEQTEEQTQDGPSELPFRDLTLNDARVRYLDHADDRDLQAAFERARLERTATGMALSAEGHVEDHPVQLQASGGGLQELLARQRFPVQATLQSKTMEAQLEGAVALGAGAPPTQLHLDIAGEDLSRLGNILGQNLEDSLAYGLAGTLRLEGSTWSLRDLDARLGESTLSGRASVTLAQPWTLDAQLHSSSLNLAQLSAITPEGEDDEGGVPLAPLQTGTARVTLQVDRLIAANVTLEDLAAQATVSDGRLQLDLQRALLPGGAVTGGAVIDAAAADPVLAVELQTAGPLALTPLARALGGEVELGRLQAAVRLQLHARDGALPTQPDQVLANLHVQPSTIAYQHLAENTRVAGSVQTASPGGELWIRAQGDLEEVPPATAELHGGRLALLLEPQQFPVRIIVDSVQSHGQIETDLAALLAPGAFQGRIELQGEDPAHLQPWLGPFVGETDIPSLPAYHIKGNLTTTDDVFEATDVSLQVGESTLRGTFAVGTAGERPHIEADLHADNLDLAQLAASLSDEEAAPAPEAPPEARIEQTAAEVLNPLDTFTAQVALNAERLVVPDGTTLEHLSFTAAVQDAKLHVNLPRARMAGGSVEAQLVVDSGKQPIQGSLDASFESVQLGTITDWFTRVDEHLGQVSGELHVDVTGVDPAQRRDDVLLPNVGRIAIHDTRLRARDADTDTDFELTLNTEGVDSAGDQRLIARASGRYRGLPMSLDLTGDPLIALRDPDDPYGLSLDLQAVQNRIQLSGTIDRPLEMRALNIDVTISGENPQRLYSVLGVPFPALPPYRANAHLEHQGSEWVLTQMDGHVGDSDIHGRLALDTSGEKPTLKGDLTSDTLDFDDLGGLVGAAPGAGPEETLSPEQQRLAEQRERRPTVLPDRDIDLQQVNAVNADVRWQARQVRAPNLPFDDISVNFRLDDGRLIFEPLEFGVGGGTVRADMVLDARDKPVKGKLSAEIASVDLSKVLAPLEIADDSVGTIAGRTTLWVEGNSVAEMLASSDGGLLLLMNGGRLDSLLVELAGLDAGETLLILVGGAKTVPVNCVFLDVYARDGVFTLQNGVVDSTDTLFVLTGSVDMNDEGLEMTLHPRPKDVSLLVARSPLHIEGSLKDPAVAPDASSLITRGAAATALAVIAGPLAGLLPLLEPGPGEGDSACGELADADLRGD